MPTLGVNVAAFQNGKILLTKREDFHVWCLPGGHADPGESLAQAAIREMEEETGLEVALDRLVGLYSRPFWEDGSYHIAVFTGRVIGGEERPQTNEVIEMRFFGPDEMPDAMMLGHRQRARDAFAGIIGVTRCECAGWPFDRPLTRQELYRVRDESGLPRAEWYERAIGRLDSQGSAIEVGPDE